MDMKFFNKLCEVLGDQELPVKERWKSLIYINTGGQGVPVGELQSLIKDNKAWYFDVDDTTKFFLIMDEPYPEFNPLTCAPTVTAFDISSIYGVSFLAPPDMVDLTDIIERITGKAPEKIPVKVTLQKEFFTNPDVDYSLEVKFNRKLEEGDWEVKWKDLKNNKELTEKPKKIGLYELKVQCVGKYEGEATCTIRIDSI